MGHLEPSTTQRELSLFGDIPAFVPAPPPIPILIRDAFTAANGTEIIGHVPDVNVPAGAWAHSLGVGYIQIQNNQLAYVSADVGVNSPVWIEAGQADLLLAQITISVIPIGGTGGVAVSLRSALNSYGIMLDVDPSGIVRLRRSSDEMILDASAAGAAAVGDVLRLRMVGNVFTGFVNAIALLSATEAFGVGRTGAGVRFLWNAGPKPALDDFVVRNIT